MPVRAWPTASDASPIRNGWRASSSVTCTPTISSTWRACATSSRGLAVARRPLPVHLPPGGRSRLDDLAAAISERPSFFDDCLSPSTSTTPDAALTFGPLTVRFAAARHYVPAWAMSVEAPDGARLVYTGDTGPSDAMTEFARGADLLLVEASLVDAGDDDDERGHLTAAEAIDLARNAAVRAARLVHYAPDRRTELEALCAAAGPWIRPAVQGLSLTVSPRVGVVRAVGPAA